MAASLTIGSYPASSAEKSIDTPTAAQTLAVQKCNRRGFLGASAAALLGLTTGCGSPSSHTPSVSADKQELTEEQILKRNEELLAEAREVSAAEFLRNHPQVNEMFVEPGSDTEVRAGCVDERAKDPRLHVAGLSVLAPEDLPMIADSLIQEALERRQKLLAAGRGGEVVKIILEPHESCGAAEKALENEQPQKHKFEQVEVRERAIKGAEALKNVVDEKLAKMGLVGLIICEIRLTKWQQMLQSEKHRAGLITVVGTPETIDPTGYDHFPLHYINSYRQFLRAAMKDAFLCRAIARSTHGRGKHEEPLIWLVADTRNRKDPRFSGVQMSKSFLEEVERQPKDRREEIGAAIDAKRLKIDVLSPKFH